MEAEIKNIDGELKIKSTSEKNSISKPIATYRFSSGQNSLIGLITNIILSDKKLYIIDEPELSFSIIWQDKLKKLFSNILNEYDKQFIILTHSYFLFGNNKKENVCVIPFPF